MTVHAGKRPHARTAEPAYARRRLAELRAANRSVITPGPEEESRPRTARTARSKRAGTRAIIPSRNAPARAAMPALRARGSLDTTCS